ncbi:MAG TPA: hypothetical protein VF017_05265 [Thermoanaerobaculia bacterium]|nr:hypothetical protein [Thermoanaerobaculia bacterium]
MRSTRPSFLLGLSLGLILSGSVVHAAGTPAGIAEGWAPGLAFGAKQGRLSLEKVRDLPGEGPAAFHPQRRLLAWSDGIRVRVELPEGGNGFLYTADGWLSDLAFGRDGTLWLALGGDLVRIEEGREVCRARQSGVSRLVPGPAQGIAGLAEATLGGSGPSGRVVLVLPDCQSQAGAWEAGPLTALAYEANGKLVARGRGPAYSLAIEPAVAPPPTVELLGPEGAVKARLPLFDGSRIEALVAHGSWLLALSALGEWQLLSRRDLTPSAAGRFADGRRALPLPDTDLVAVGDGWIDLTRGVALPGRLPAAASATAPDGSWWVLEQPEGRSVWRLAPGKGRRR